MDGQKKEQDVTKVEDATVTNSSTIILSAGDTALVFRKGSHNADLVIPDGNNDDSASTGTIIAVAVGIEINRNPVWLQSVIDKNVMFSGVKIDGTE